MDIRNPLEAISRESNDQENLYNYNQSTSLYLTEKVNNTTKLIIYEAENGRAEVRMLDTPVPLDPVTCITQLPNGEIFCFGNYAFTGITLIIDCKYEYRVLPSDHHASILRTMFIALEGKVKMMKI